MDWELVFQIQQSHGLSSDWARSWPLACLQAQFPPPIIVMVVPADPPPMMVEPGWSPLVDETTLLEVDEVLLVVVVDLRSLDLMLLEVADFQMDFLVTFLGLLTLLTVLLDL